MKPKLLSSSFSTRIYHVVNRLLTPMDVQIISLPRKTKDLLRDLLGNGSEAYVIDIGAAVGDFATHVFDVVPQATVVCIEPIQKHHAGLQERFKHRSVKTIHSAVGDNNGEITFHETALPDCSSVLLMRHDKTDFPKAGTVTSTYQVPLRRLDTLLTEVLNDPPVIDLLKIDVQGFELPVLKGATTALSRCKNVLLEISLRPVYEGQENFEEIVMFMHQHGFRMVDYIEGSRSYVNHELVQMDFLYQASSH